MCPGDCGSFILFPPSALAVGFLMCCHFLSNKAIFRGRVSIALEEEMSDRLRHRLRHRLHHRLRLGLF